MKDGQRRLLEWKRTRGMENSFQERVQGEHPEMVVRTALMATAIVWLGVVCGGTYWLAGLVTR